jgi:iron(III) transport system ATP-binding protein
MNPALEIRDLHIHYGDFGAVNGVDLDLLEGQLTALVGPSGCGKTSLLRAIAGFETPAHGSVRKQGETLASPGSWVVPEKRRIGMVFQQGALFPHLTVRQNVLYGLKGHSNHEKRAREALNRVRMEHRTERFADELSGGEQQRVALARALAPDPHLVLLDEPFANLDASLREELREEVRSILHEAGTTVLLVTHDQEEALSMADIVAVMMHGKILQVGPPDEIYHHPACLEAARFIGDSQLLDCHVSNGCARSILGEARCLGEDGPGHLLVRPEDLALRPPDRTPSARISNRSFFGHDLIDKVTLENGIELRVRCLSSDCFQVGDPVSVRMREKTFHVFPAQV